MVAHLAAREWRPGSACRIVEKLNDAAAATLEPEMSSVCLGNQLSSYDERVQGLSASFSAFPCRGRAAALLLGRAGAKAFVPLVFLDLVANAGAVSADLVCDAADGASLVPHSTAMQSLSCGHTMLVVAHSFQLSTLIETTNVVAFRSAPRLCRAGLSCCTQNANPPSSPCSMELLFARLNPSYRLCFSYL